jgi:hypothetical protein
MLPGLAPTPIFRRYGNRKPADQISPGSFINNPTSPLAANLLTSEVQGEGGGGGRGLPDFVADLVRSTEKIPDGSAPKRRRVIDLLSAASDDDDNDDDNDNELFTNDKVDMRVGILAAKSKGRSATTLREAGRAKSSLDDMVYYIEGLRIEHSISVRLDSLVALSKILMESSARRIFRSHGLASNLVTATKSILFSSSSEELELLFGICTLLFQLFSDGVRPNLDLVAEPVIHLVLRALVFGCVWIGEIYPDLLYTSSKRSLQKLLQQGHTTSSTLTKTALRDCGDKFQHVFASSSFKQGGLGVLGGLSSIQPLYESGSTTLSLQDLALYLIWRLTFLSEAADVTDVTGGVSGGIATQDSNTIDVTSSSAADVENSSSLQQQQQQQQQQQLDIDLDASSSSDSILASHMSLSRDAVRTALNGQGLVAISIVCAASSKTIFSIEADSKLACSHAQDLHRVRLCLNTLENATFLSVENTLFLTSNVSIRSDLVFCSLMSSTSKSSAS